MILTEGGIGMYSMYRDFIPRVVKKKEINVIGAATKLVKSDMAILIIELTAENTDPIQAINDIRELTATSKDYLEEYGIKEEDVFYSRRELKPIYNENNEIIKYTATNVFRIRFYDIQRISEFLFDIKDDEVSVKEVIFTVENPVMYYNLALEAAVSNAYDKVAKVAEEMEVIIESTPQDITETTDVNEVLESIGQKEDSKFFKGFITLYATVEAKFMVMD